VRNSNGRQLSVQACVDEFDDGLFLSRQASDFNRRMSLRLVYVFGCNDGLFLRPAYVINSNVRQLSVQVCVDECDDGLSLSPISK
jgi:hypothetical protein